MVCFCSVCRTLSLFFSRSLSLSGSLSVSQTKMFLSAPSASDTCSAPPEWEWTQPLGRGRSEPQPAPSGKSRRRRVIKPQPKHQEPFAFLLHLKRMWQAHYLCETEGGPCVSDGGAIPVETRWHLNGAGRSGAQASFGASLSALL